MTNDEKLMWMFDQVHGEITNCYTEIEEDDFGNAVAVNVMKHGNVCWTAAKTDLVFDYLTKHLEE